MFPVCACGNISLETLSWVSYIRSSHGDICSCYTSIWWLCVVAVCLLWTCGSCSTSSTVVMLLLLLITIEVRCARPGESENTLSVQRPQPHTTNPWKEEKVKIVGDKKRKGRFCQQESIGSALETCQSHTIKYRVTKIVPKRHREGHKGSAILRSPTTGRRERVPMSNQTKHHE